MCLPLLAQSLRDLPPPKPAGENGTVVIGLLGGFDHWNDGNRGVRKLVLRLRETPGITAESFSNHRRHTATQYLLKLLDANGDGVLDDGEKARARVVLFGQSLGGAQVVAMARDLNRRGIPVLLTVQVDSVGLHDSRIPPNVHEAANFYQSELLTFRGQREIRAMDPAHTKILANIQFHYPPFVKPAAPPESWARRNLGGGHARLEADPLLWTQVETMIRRAIAESSAH